MKTNYYTSRSAALTMLSLLPHLLSPCSDQNFNSSIIEQGVTCLGEFQFKESRLSYNSRAEEEDFMNRQENKEKLQEIIKNLQTMSFVVYGKVEEEKKYLQEAYLNLTHREMSPKTKLSNRQKTSKLTIFHQALPLKFG